MSDTIPIGFAQKYRGDVIMLSQQKDSRLERAVRRDPDYLEGKYGYYDRIAATEAVEVTTRHGDTPRVDTAHSRRRIGLRDYDWADLIDKRDMRRIIAAGAMPERYRINAVSSMNRWKDRRIIAAMNGNAYSIDEDDAATTVALPSAQKVAVASAGLTVAKVIEANEILLSADVDEEEPRFAAYTAKQLTNLLNTTEVKSRDYNNVQALVEGKITRWMGFEWIHTELLETDSSSNRLLPFWHPSAVGLAIGGDIETDIAMRRDKRNSTQVYACMSLDATRIEDEKIVQVACSES